MTADYSRCTRCGVARQVNSDRRARRCRDCMHIVDRDGTWMERGACRPPHDPEWWWPASSDPALSQRALGICAVCPVVDECLAYALTGPETHGIWGGTTPQQRLALRSYARRTLTPYNEVRLPRNNRLESAS